MLFPCLVFLLTVKHPHNEVLPGFELVSLMQILVTGEMSVFSCWQSIYLPFNVVYVWNERWRMRAVDLHACFHWEIDLSGELDKFPWPIKQCWIIQSHTFAAHLNSCLINVETSTKYSFCLFPHFNKCVLFVCLFFFFCRPGAVRCRKVWLWRFSAIVKVIDIPEDKWISSLKPEKEKDALT